MTHAVSPAREPAATASPTLYGGTGTRRITVRDLTLAKERGEKWPMLTAYDAMTASVFDEAGIPVILVGDSMGNCHLGYDSTVPVTMDQMTMLSAASYVARAAPWSSATCRSARTRKAPCRRCAAPRAWSRRPGSVP